MDVKAKCGHGIATHAGLCRSCYEKDLRKRNPAFAERQRANCRRWSKKNADKVAESHRVYQRTHRTRIRKYKRRWKLDRRFGITEEQYTAMLSAQNNVCAICGRSQKKRLAVDHCHKTGAIRGLLCFRCNFGLGWFSDNSDTFKKIVQYLSNNCNWLIPAIPKTECTGHHYTKKIHVGFQRSKDGLSSKG